MPRDTCVRCSYILQVFFEAPLRVPAHHLGGIPAHLTHLTHLPRETLVPRVPQLEYPEYP